MVHLGENVHVGRMGTLDCPQYLCYAISNFVMINTKDTFFDKELPQKVLGGLDEVCRLCDEF